MHQSRTKHSRDRLSSVCGEKLARRTNRSTKSFQSRAHFGQRGLLSTNYSDLSLLIFFGQTCAVVKQVSYLLAQPERNCDCALYVLYVNSPTKVSPGISAGDSCVCGASGCKRVRLHSVSTSGQRQRQESHIDYPESGNDPSETKDVPKFLSADKPYQEYNKRDQFIQIIPNATRALLRTNDSEKSLPITHGDNINTGCIASWSIQGEYGTDATSEFAGLHDEQCSSLQAHEHVAQTFARRSSSLKPRDLARLKIVTSGRGAEVEFARHIPKVTSKPHYLQPVAAFTHFRHTYIHRLIQQLLGIFQGKTPILDKLDYITEEIPVHTESEVQQDTYGPKVNAINQGHILGAGQSPSLAWPYLVSAWLWLSQVRSAPRQKIPTSATWILRTQRTLTRRQRGRPCLHKYASRRDASSRSSRRAQKPVTDPLKHMRIGGSATRIMNEGQTRLLESGAAVGSQCTLTTTAGTAVAAWPPSGVRGSQPIGQTRLNTKRLKWNQVYRLVIYDITRYIVTSVSSIGAIAKSKARAIAVTAKHTRDAFDP